MKCPTRAFALLAIAVLLGGSPARAGTTAAKIPVNTSATVVGSCNVGGAIGNSPQTQNVQIGPLTWTLHGQDLSPATPIVTTVAPTCSRGDTITVSLPAPPAGGFQADSTKNPLKLPYVIWVTASIPTTCNAPPSTTKLTQVSLSSTQPTRFYIAACAIPKPNQESTGDYTATLNATLQF